MKAKINVKQVTVTRAEGPCELCVTKIVGSIPAANDILAHNSLTGPERGYDKHDVTVEWEDGQTYEARIDVEHVDNGGAERIGKHIKDFLRFSNGLLEAHEVPSHLTMEDYQRYVRISIADKPERRANAIEFLETYDLGDF